MSENQVKKIGGSTVVENSAHIHEIEGSNPDAVIKENFTAVDSSVP